MVEQRDILYGTICVAGPPVPVPVPITDIYEGPYTITPAIALQTLQTMNKMAVDNITVNSIPYYETTNPTGKTVIIGGL